MTNIPDETEALAAVARGELAEFTKLYDMYLERIYAFVFYRLPHKEIAEDVTSDVFVSALEKIATFNPGKASFATWLYAIARNKVIDHTRTRKPTEDIEIASNIAGTHNPEREASTAYDIGKINEFLSTQSQVQRDIVIMRVWDDLPHREIAKILDMSEAAVKMNYFRTIAKLQTEFGGLAITLLLLLKPY